MSTTGHRSAVRGMHKRAHSSAAVLFTTHCLDCLSLLRVVAAALPSTALATPTFSCLLQSLHHCTRRHPTLPAEQSLIPHSSQRRERPVRSPLHS